MKMKNITLVAGLAVTLVSGSFAQGQTLVSDNYQITTVSNGFALGEGVNTGIVPPATRMTGTIAENLRYIKTAGTRADSNYDINANRLRVNTESAIGRFSISANGATAFNFAPALGAAYASPTNKATYDVQISMRNNATSTARFAFAIGTADTDANNWDFGVQLFRATGTDFYTMQRRIDTASSGEAVDVNAAMGTTGAGTAGSATVTFLIRVTDAGAETNAFNSRVQVSIDNGATWLYDTATDSLLPAGFRFDGPGRFVSFDQASNNSGAVFYDNFSIVSTYAPLPPSSLVWTGAGADSNWSTANNWGGTALSAGTPLIFNGTTRQANVNDLLDLTVPSVTFNNGGFSLSGNPFVIDSVVSNLAGANTFAGDFSLGSTGLKTWSVASGSDLTLNNTTAIEVGGDNGLVGGGSLLVKGTMNIGVATTANPAFIIFDGKHIVDGGTFTSRGGYRIGSQANGSVAETILTNGANFNLTVAGGNLRVGDSANPVTSRLIIDNSTLTMTGGTLGIPYTANSTGEVIQKGGTVSGGIVAFSDAGVGTGTYTIQNGGILEPLQIREDNAAGLSAIFFNNATLRPASGANAQFFSGIDLAEIQAGGLTLDVSGDVSIGQTLTGPGPLTKSGFGTATLSAANTYSGNTIVQTGRLVLPTVQTNATAVQVAGGAEFGVRSQTQGSTLSVSSINFASGSSLNLDLGSFPNPTAPLAKVSNLSVSGPVTVNVANGLELTTGQIVLLDYSGAISGGFQFSLGSLPSGVIANLVNNVGNSSIDLNITGVPGYRWTGAVNGEWDGATVNWINLQTGSPSVFADGFPALFLDGASTGNINITGFPTPTIISISNNTLPYVWSGGALTVPILKKSGTSSVTRVESGADFINQIELNAGSYIINDSFDLSFTTILSDTSAGNGTFVKQGASTLTIASTNNSTYDGAILVQQGTLKLGQTNSPLGSTNGATTIASGATLDLNDIVAPHEPVIVSGAGVGGLGAIIDSNAAGGVANNLTDVTMVGNTTFGSSGRWDLRVRSGTGPGPGLRGNGFNLTKVGSGAVSIASQRNIGVTTPYWEMNLGDIFINEGSLTFAESLSLGNPAKTITIASGATLSTFDLGATNPIVRNIFMTDATITGGGGANDTNVFNGAIQVTGAGHLRPLDTKLFINGAIGGSGSVNVSSTGVGALFLNGVNTYPGDTTVTNGILGGFGVIAGNLIMLDGTNSPGVGIGTLTVNGSATLAGTTLMELNRSQSPNSDRLVVGGTLTKNGALTVVLGAGAPSPQAGDVYQLFNKGGSGTFAPITLPNLSALPGGLAWDTSNLNINGTITVTGTATPPTISNVSVSGNNFVFSGTGGVEGGTYTVLSSTNIALPVANWTPIATNVFGQGGSFSYTNVINPATPATFFLLQVP